MLDSEARCRVSSSLRARPSRPACSLNGSSITISTDGVVLDGFDLREKTVNVTASNVTIRNSIFTAPNGAYWTVQITSGTNLTVEDSTFDGLKRNNSISDAIWATSNAGSTTIRRNKFIDWPSDVLNVQGGLVERNYFAGASYASGAHADAIYMGGQKGGTLTVQYNYVDFLTRPDAPQSTNNCVRITTENGPMTASVNIHNNVFRGGSGYTISITSDVIGLLFQDNRLQDTDMDQQYGPKDYYFYSHLNGTVTGNTDYLTNAVINNK